MRTALLEVTLSALVTLFVTPLCRAQNLFKPDFVLRADRTNVLMAADARLSPGLIPTPGDHRKLEVRGWTKPGHSFSWEVKVPESREYAVNVLVEHRSGSPVALRVTSKSESVETTVTHLRDPERYRWRRYPFRRMLRLEKGTQTITLQAAGAMGDFELAAWSVELVLPSVQARLEETARKLRAKPDWFIAAKYGFMMHWTPQSWPRHGERKSYADAVRDFNVEAFADQVREGGAGFVVLVTAHALQYFPAPIQALEHILAGRTSQRDLVADLAAALSKRDIKLMLYYHLGAAEDPEWLKAASFWETGTTKFFGNWERIITEIGNRYGDRLAGWWFDDGMCNYYYRSPDWERLYRVSKSGNPARLTTFNRWLWPAASEFQDYDACEVCTDASANGWLPVGGSGRYTDGPAKGFQAAATLISEGDWVHSKKDTEVGPPRWNTEQLRAYLRDFIARKNVPIFNLEIYQEGLLSPASIAVFHDAGRGL